MEKSSNSKNRKTSGATFKSSNPTSVAIEGVKYVCYKCSSVYKTESLITLRLWSLLNRTEVIRTILCPKCQNLKKIEKQSADGICMYCGKNVGKVEVKVKTDVKDFKVEQVSVVCDECVKKKEYKA